MSSVLELLTQLLACPSVTPNDAGCQEIVAARLAAAGFAVERLRFGATDNLWATHGEGAPLLCLAGHTDVVPPGPLDAWSSPPFAPEVREGRLYARGASDMKASDAAMTVALEGIARDGHRGTVALLLTSDEEGPGHDGTGRVLAHLIERGVRIDAAVVGEPTSETRFGDAMKNGRRGSMTGSVVVTGIQGHTAYPHLADNAAHRLAPALAELVALDWGTGNPDFPPTTLQVCHLAAGTGASNVVPGRCEVRFNVRFGTANTEEEIMDRVGAVFARHGILDKVAWNVSARPFLTAPGALLEAIATAVEAETGVRPRPSTGGGTSDARCFAAHGIPVAEFGPSNATIHAVDECVEVACLEPLARIYKATVKGYLDLSHAEGV
ncbi:MAG: succinyl-diaminopimelate desuccinylase [Fimbriimonas sp.]